MEDQNKGIINQPQTIDLSVTETEEDEDFDFDNVPKGTKPFGSPFATPYIDRSDSTSKMI